MKAFLTQYYFVYIVGNLYIWSSSYKYIKYFFIFTILFKIFDANVVPYMVAFCADLYDADSLILYYMFISL